MYLYPSILRRIWGEIRTTGHQLSHEPISRTQVRDIIKAILPQLCVRYGTTALIALGFVNLVIDRTFERWGKAIDDKPHLPVPTPVITWINENPNLIQQLYGSMSDTPIPFFKKTRGPACVFQARESPNEYQTMTCTMDVQHQRPSRYDTLYDPTKMFVKWCEYHGLIASLEDRKYAPMFRRIKDSLASVSSAVDIQYVCYNYWYCDPLPADADLGILISYLKLIDRVNHRIVNAQMDGAYTITCDGTVQDYTTTLIPIENSLMDSACMEELERAVDLHDMYKSKVRDLNLPTKHVILIHGVPGTGKSFFARYLAQKMRRNIEVINTLSDLDKICRASSSILLLDEFDRLLVQVEIEEDNDKDGKTGGHTRPATIIDESTKPNLRAITTLQDALDYCAPANIVIMTTNFYDKLSTDKCCEHLLRAGRIDTTIAIPPHAEQSAIKRYGTAIGLDVDWVENYAATHATATIAEVASDMRRALIDKCRQEVATRNHAVPGADLASQ